MRGINQERVTGFCKIIKQGSIKNKWDINNSGKSSDTVKCMLEIINDYMEIKTTVKTKNSDAPFEQAVKRGDVEKVREIIESGRGVNKEFENGDTPLERAIYNNQPEIVTLLIEKGALLAPHLNNDGMGYKVNPLAIAIANKAQDMMELLIKKGMDVRYECSKKDSLLFYAYNMDCQSAVEVLLKSGADINQKNEKGRCLLAQAIIDENKGMVDLLISYGSTIDSIIEGKLWGLNNIHTKLKQDHFEKIGEFIMTHTMKEMITQRNDSEAPTVHDPSATEKQIIEGIINNSDGVHLDHTGYIGHATCTLTMTGKPKFKYLIHTNKGSGAIKNTDGKARPMVICSKDDLKIYDVKNQLLEFKKTQNSMDQSNQMLESFQSGGGNQQFMEAVESIAAKSQTMSNCWIKSYNQALKIRLFIGFLKANGFKFDENPGDDDTIKNALKDAITLFRKIRLARVEASIRMVELKRGKSEAVTQQDKDLLTNLKRKRVKINDKILGEIYHKIIGKIYNKIIIRNIV